MEDLPYVDAAAACDALSRGEVRAVVYDAPILRHLLNRHSERKLQLVGPLFDKQDYGFGLRGGSPLREPINRALLALEEQGVVDELAVKWFGTAP